MVVIKQLTYSSVVATARAVAASGASEGRLAARRARPERMGRSPQARSH